MIICSCNVLSDHQVRDVVAHAAPRSPVQVYGCLGCNPRCGRCMRTIKTIMDEGSAVCAGGNSPHD
jgi:bacterioferritin-associated ferredoxin